MAKPTGQVGGRKEAPLVIVGSNYVAGDQAHTRNLTPEDIEYEGYTQLFRGFFEKFTRWREMLQEKEYQRGERWREFNVLASPNGHPYIAPTRDTEPPGRILHVMN